MCIFKWYVLSSSHIFGKLGSQSIVILIERLSPFHILIKLKNSIFNNTHTGYREKEEMLYINS